MDRNNLNGLAQVAKRGLADLAASWYNHNKAVPETDIWIVLSEARIEGSVRIMS
jgi:hypothetical protein